MDCGLTNDGRCRAYWQSRVQFYWTQRFKAGATLEVRHTYSPIVGGSWGYTKTDVKSMVEPYCGGSDAVARFSRSLPQDAHDNPVLVGRQIDYILTTANNWRGPIGCFRLAVVADQPEDLVVTCLPGLRRIGPVRYEWKEVRFQPSSDLHLLILQRPR